MNEPSPNCPDCGAPLRIVNPGRNTWTATCPDCYDGTEDSSERSRVMGVGPTPLTAKRAWHEKRKDIDELRTPEQVRRDAIQGELGRAQDNLHRARAAARGRDVNAQWGESGKTLAQIISEYEEWVREVEAAL